MSRLLALFALCASGVTLLAQAGAGLPSPSVTTLYTNAGTTGTTLNKLAKLTGAPSTAVITATTDTSGAVGVVIAGAGTTGSATIQSNGVVSLVMDGATTAGDYVQISGTTAGDGHDIGAMTCPTSGGQVIGRVLSTNVGGGTYQVLLGTGGCGTGTASSATGLFNQILSATPTKAGTGLTTAYNQQGTFFSADNATGFTIGDTAANTQIEGWVKAYPATPFTAIALIAPQSWSASINFQRFGLVVANTTTGANMIFDVGSSSNVIAQVSGSTNPSFGSVTNIVSSPVLPSWPEYEWMKYVDNGTNITFSISSDGSNWVQVYTVSRASSYLGSSGFNFFGFVVAPTGAPMSATLLSYVD